MYQRREAQWHHPHARHRGSQLDYVFVSVVVLAEWSGTKFIDNQWTIFDHRQVVVMLSPLPAHVPHQRDPFRTKDATPTFREYTDTPLISMKNEWGGASLPGACQTSSTTRRRSTPSTLIVLCMRYDAGEQRSFRSHVNIAMRSHIIFSLARSCIADRGHEQNVTDHLSRTAGELRWKVLEGQGGGGSEGCPPARGRRLKSPRP